MKIIYTIKNPETNDAYVGYTNSFARRITQHIANWLLVALQIPTTMPLMIALKTGKAIIDVFIAWNDYRGAEKSQISKMKWEGWNLLNKTKWWNGK